MRMIARVLAAAGIALSTTMVAAVPASAGGGCHGPLTDRTGVHVDLSALCFTPTVLRVQPGASVDWVNRDGLQHTVTAAGSAFDQTLEDGQAFTRRFGQAGTFPYYCRLHPGMVGVVIVGDGGVAGQPAVAAVAAQVDKSRPSPLSQPLIAAVGLLLLTAIALWAWRRVNGPSAVAATDTPQRMMR